MTERQFVTNARHTSEPAPLASSLSPFQHPTFVLLWSAGIVSNIGTWMYEVGAGWLMTELNPDPLMVSLVRATTTFPVFLFAMIAGTVADRSSKRSYLIAASLFRMAVTSTLAVIVYTGQVTDWLLLSLTFLMGVGTAFMAPAWLSVVPKLVPPEKMQPAIALNSLGINVSRAIGPAIAGYLILGFGLHAPFVLNAFSFTVIITALSFWSSGSAKPDRAETSLWHEMKRGFEEGLTNIPLRRTLLHVISFFIFASAFWALLPLSAKAIDPNGADLFGLMMTCAGVGAIAGAFILPRFRAVGLSLSLQYLLGKLTMGAALLILSQISSELGLLVGAFIGGTGWILVMVSTHTGTQRALSDRMRARGSALLLMILFGSVAAGSTLWGQVASSFGLSETFLLASGTLVTVAAFMFFAVRLDHPASPKT